MLKEKKRTDLLTRRESKESSIAQPSIPPLSLMMPKTLNPRASMLIPKNPSPRGTSPVLGANRARAISHNSVLSTSAPSSPRVVIPQSQPKVVPLVLASHSTDDEDAERDEEDVECKALLIKKEFITRSLKAKSYVPKKMVSADISFFEQPTDSGRLSDFCVTEHSTPCGTPPPERRMPNFEIANMRVEIKKLKDQMVYISSQQRDINNYFLEIKRLREEEKSQATCCWFGF